ncbi:hypothetical protein BDW74DRAFT_172176 [Aspergillus multicolor]|uniref:uncharacterized protein n=1 Tax=Aspergillus multicolor TaxID=41759 RepID=UPI003CCCD8A6
MEPEAPTGWNACPPELLHLIAQQLSVGDHRALCHVNKTFHSIANPLLYSKVHFTWQTHRGYDGPPEQRPPLTEFLRTLFSPRGPQLARYVRDLRLDGNTHFSHPYRFKLPTLSIAEHELEGPVRFIRSIGLPGSDSDRWIQALREGSLDAFIALLLARLPRLKSLYLGPWFTRRTALIGVVLQCAICERTDPTIGSLPDFEHLQDVTILRCRGRDDAPECDKKVKNTADLLPLFYLPNLQTLSAAIQNPGVWTWPAPAHLHLPHPFKLTSLDLTCIREAYLRNILAVLPNLTTLRWNWYYDDDVHDRFITETIFLPQITAALEQVKSTLRDLIITAFCSNANDPFIPAVTTQGLDSMKALVSFDMLRNLQIPLEFLVGFAQDTTKRLVDVLPPNLQTLTLTDDLALQNEDHLTEELPEWEWTDHAIIDLLEAWLMDRNSDISRLRHVTLRLEHIDTDMNQWMPAACHRLWEMGTRVGIPVELVDLSRRWRP